MLFRNYEYFMAIIEAGGVSRAAEKLFITQSSVSKYIKRLEDNAGFALFNRESYLLKLTKAGELYMEYVKDIIAKEKQLIRALADLHEGTRGLIRLGITPWRSSIIMPAVLPGFDSQYPNIKIEIYEGPHQDLASMLELDKIDFSVFHLPHSYQNITFEHLFYEPVLLAINKAHHLLESIDFDPQKRVNTISRKDFIKFRKQRFILLKQGQNIRELTQNFLNRFTIEPEIILETSNNETALNMTVANMGVSFTPGAILKMKKYADDIVFFMFDDPPLQWEVGIAYKTGNTPGKQARLFIDSIRDFFYDSAGDGNDARKDHT